MKPGTLFVLNRTLCLRLEPDRRYVWCPPVARVQPMHVPPTDPRPIEPALRRRGGLEAAPPRSRGRWWWKALAWVGLLAVFTTANFGWMAVERIERARERHQFGRAIAERERQARWLLDANRHMAGVVRVQHAMLLKSGESTRDALVRVNLARRPTNAGI